MDVYLEAGSRRVFAGALAWPGLSRSGRDEDGALEALVAHCPRYQAALGKAARGFMPPAAASELEVVERLDGDATTDFGAPSKTPKSDRSALEKEEAERLAEVLRASWAAFDRAAAAARGRVLSKGPRGGGRELDAIVEHVLGAERSYLSRVGGTYRNRPDPGVRDEMRGVRRAFLEAFGSRAGGGPPPRVPRSGKLWTPRYAVRRSAWHALDHAWEIEDRAGSGRLGNA